MQALINDLLAFSRVGRIERPRELVDVGELVAHATSALGLAIEEAGATVEVDAAACPRSTASGRCSGSCCRT